MHLVDLLSPARVAVGTGITSKKKLLEHAATLLTDGQGGELERAVFDSLCARERLGSTGLGQGVAIPHGRTAGLGSASGAFLRLSEPVEFGAPDTQPVDLVFALAVPEHFTHQHLILLSELSELFGDADFRVRLRAATDGAALYRLLTDWQQAHHAAA